MLMYVFMSTIMMVFLMTCLPGCKSVTSAENTRIETAETLTETITVSTPESPKGDFASPNSSIFWSVDSFPMFRYASLRESGRVEAVLKVFRLPRQALPAIVNSRPLKDEFKSRRNRGIFFAGRAKTTRLFKHNKPTILTKQPDCLDKTARLFRQYSPTVQII